MKLPLIRLISQFSTLIILVGSLFIRPNAYGSAEAMRKQLIPVNISDEVGPRDLADTKKRLIPILEMLESTNTTNKTSPKTLLRQATELIENKVGQQEAIVTNGRILKNWETAHSLGLFNERGRFTDRIQHGRDAGKKPVFEYIVPPKHFPKFSTHLANVRLIEPSKARGKDGDYSPRDVAFAEQLKSIRDEMEVNAAPGELAEEKWEAALKEAGESFNQMPIINAEGKMAASPSHMTKNRWRIEATIENTSRHPTEVEVRCWIFGKTDKKRDRYIMSKETKPIKLMPGASKMLEFYTASEQSYKNKADDHDELDKKERRRSRIYFRGYAIKVTHAKGTAALAASDQHLLSYIDDDTEESVSQILDFSGSGR